MEWHPIVRSEFARLKRPVDESVVEEFAQHAADAWHASRADGDTPDEAEARVRALVESWCAATTGPRRIERLRVVEPAPAGPPSPEGFGAAGRS
jgi:hypothetical protein